MDDPIPEVREARPGDAGLVDGGGGGRITCALSTASVLDTSLLCSRLPLFEFVKARTREAAEGPRARTSR